MNCLKSTRIKDKNVPFYSNPGKRWKVIVALFLSLAVIQFLLHSRFTDNETKLVSSKAPTVPVRAKAHPTDPISELLTSVDSVSHATFREVQQMVMHNVSADIKLTANIAARYMDEYYNFINPVRLFWRLSP